MEKAISRQRAWQMRKRAAGLCIICGKPRVSATHCEAHRVAFNADHAIAQRRRRARDRALDSTHGTA